MKIEWPNNCRIAVNLGFDVDAETTWTDGIRNDATHLTNMSRGTYGPKQGIPRILNMLDAHGIKGTFFIPAINVLKYPEMVREIVRRGNEIAYHGYRHCEDPNTTMEQEDASMYECERIFREVAGVTIRGHRSPGGMYYDFNNELFPKHGYIYSSNYAHCDAPYIHEKDGKKIPIVELNLDWVFDDTCYDMYTDSPPERYGLKTGPQLKQIWQDEFDGLAAEGGKVIDFIIHPQFMGRVSRLNALSELVDHMQANGAWIATNEEIAEYILQKEGLL